MPITGSHSHSRQAGQLRVDVPVEEVVAEHGDADQARDGDGAHDQARVSALVERRGRSPRWRRSSPAIGALNAARDAGGTAGEDQAAFDRRWAGTRRRGGLRYRQQAATCTDGPSRPRVAPENNASVSRMTLPISDAQRQQRELRAGPSPIFSAAIACGMPVPSVPGKSRSRRRR